MRLQKYLSLSGVSSRRKAEELILNGEVKVNGNIVDKLGTLVEDNDIVEYKGKIISPIEDKIYILLNKPTKYICSNFDKQNRDLAIDLIPKEYHSGLYNVGRLDYMSQGAIIFTNDGDFANTIMHPSNEIKKTYYVKTDSIVDENLLKKFQKCFIFNDIKYKIDSYKIVSEYEYEITLNEGKNREIRNLFNANNIGIKKLARIKIGNLLLDVKTGDWRFLTKAEISDFLKKGVNNDCSY